MSAALPSQGANGPALEGGAAAESVAEAARMGAPS